MRKTAENLGRKKVWKKGERFAEGRESVDWYPRLAMTHIAAARAQEGLTVTLGGDRLTLEPIGELRVLVTCGDYEKMIRTEPKRVRWPRYIHCPKCKARRMHLYWRNDDLSCRECHCLKWYADGAVPLDALTHMLAVTERALVVGPDDPRPDGRTLGEHRKLLRRYRLAKGRFDAAYKARIMVLGKRAQKTVSKRS